MTLVDQRCLHHPGREAVARCPECLKTFCRECVTEHEDRVLCAACLRKLHAATGARAVSFSSFKGVLTCLLGLLIAWLFFYCLGLGLLAIPDSFHEGTVWTVDELDVE
jgi:hypothetical protein